MLSSPANTPSACGLHIQAQMERPLLIGWFVVFASVERLGVIQTASFVRSANASRAR